MRYALVVLFLLGCGIETPDIEVETQTLSINWSAYLKQVDGILYIVDANGLCISIDPSTVYPDEWTNLEDFDSYRPEYTQTEIDNCNAIEQRD